MKCKTCFELLAVPSAQFPGAWHCRRCDAAGEGGPTTTCPECGAAVSQKAGRIPLGTELELPEAWQLVRRGAAVPADDECARRANMRPGAQLAAQRAQHRALLGIHPDDFAAFDAGVMVGYDEHGQPIPGPNAEEEEEE